MVVTGEASPSKEFQLQALIVSSSDYFIISSLCKHYLPQWMRDIGDENYLIKRYLVFSGAPGYDKRNDGTIVDASNASRLS